MEPRPRVNKKGNYEQEIMGCLENKTMGLTVTNIANLLGISRNTVSKYLGILEVQHLVGKQDIGAYRLYFAKTNDLGLPHNFMNSFIKGFLGGLKKEFANNSERFKKIGEEIEQYVRFPLIGGEVDQVESWLHNLSSREFLEVVAFILPRIFFIAENVRVKSFTIDEGGTKAQYILTDTALLESEDYIYGFHLMAGFFESHFRTKYKITVRCIVGDYDFSQDLGESYLNIFVEVLDI